MRDSRGTAGRAPAHGWVGSGAIGSVRRIVSMIRRIAGMPEYDAHLEHLRRTHSDRPIPTEREYFEEFVRCRYEDGPTRCC